MVSAYGYSPLVVFRNEICRCTWLKFISSVDRASDRHAADAGSIPRCGKVFFSQSQFSVQTLLRCPYIPVCNPTRGCKSYLHLCARQRSRCPCHSSVDYENTKTPSMHPRLGSATLSLLAFPGEGNPNFLWEKFHWNNKVVKS